jgi:peptidoglycan-N-acetylglucosamine deacetylase
MIGTNFAWPNGADAAISLTFDDGMRSQLDVAVPLMDSHQVHGTFYLNPKEEYRTQLAPWQQVAAAGHEIGNHTVSHPCSQNFAFITDAGRRGLEQMDLVDIELEIREAGERIREVIPKQLLTSFAYPCYQPFVGRGSARTSYVPVVLRHCVAGRGRGEQPNDPRYCDLGYLWSWPCERMSGAHMIGMVEQTAAMSRWGILTFHGIHEGHLSVGNREFEELCSYLAKQRKRIWTAPLATVAQYVAEWQSTHAAGT